MLHNYLCNVVTHAKGKVASVSRHSTIDERPPQVDFAHSERETCGSLALMLACACAIVVVAAIDALCEQVKRVVKKEEQPS